MWSVAAVAALGCLWAARRLALPVTRLGSVRPAVNIGTNALAAFVGLAGVVAIGPAGLLLAVVPVGIDRLRTQRARSQYRRQVIAALPSLADLLSVAVTAGYGPASALERVNPHVAPVLAPHLDRLVLRVARGASLRDELRTLGHELGQSAEPLVRVLDAALVDGVGSAGALRAAATDLRLFQRRAREAEIAALPVRLLFPLVVCILPAFVLLTLVPLLTSSLADVTAAL